MSRILCVTGTGTEAGKTAVSLAMLLWAKSAGIRAAYVKLVQCGSRLPSGEPFQGDAEWIAAALPGTEASALYSFPDPVSPHLAAEKAGAWMDPGWIFEKVEEAAHRNDLLIIEGAGGAATPFLRDGFSLADAATRGHWPCLLVCPHGVGALHQGRAAAQFLASRGAALAGFAMSQSTPDPSPVYADNVAILTSLLPAHFFGLVPYCPGLHKRLPLPPAMATHFGRSLAGMGPWWHGA